MSATSGVCAYCGQPIRRHPYKGWYHSDGRGKGHRDHSPDPDKPHYRGRPLDPKKLETWHCIDCGKDFELDVDKPLNEQVAGHTYGHEKNTLRHLVDDDFEPVIEPEGWH